MCVAALDWQPGGPVPLRLWSNRDEFFARPTLPMAWWSHQGAPVLSGRDQRAGGTWMAMNASGRLALVTNFRRGLPEVRQSRSRGELPLTWLSAHDPASWLQSLQPLGYAPFNWLGFDLARGEAFWVHHNGVRMRQGRLHRGVHGLSNGILDERWPKTCALIAALTQSPPAPADEPLPLPPALLDTRPAPAQALPSTGLDPARERLLSSVFIAPQPTAGPANAGSASTAPALQAYGTRCSSVVAVNAYGARWQWRVAEWQHLAGQPAASTVQYRFTSPA